MNSNMLTFLHIRRRNKERKINLLGRVWFGDNSYYHPNNLFTLNKYNKMKVKNIIFVGVCKISLLKKKKDKISNLLS